MSRRHGRPGRTTPRPPRVPRRQLDAAVAKHARMLGCHCDMDVEVTHDPDGVPSALGRHDPGCPAQHHPLKQALAVLHIDPDPTPGHPTGPRPPRKKPR